MTAGQYAQQVKAELKDTWLANIYRDRIRKLRTRAYKFPDTINTKRVVIQHTLLGVELKVGSKRMLCPDLATARYLSIFARISCNEIAVPYDITKISRFADELESSWHRMLLLVDHSAAHESEAIRTRIKNALISQLKSEIGEAGSGPATPEFRQSTKQRRTTS